MFHRTWSDSHELVQPDSTRLQTMQQVPADTRFHIYSQSAAPQGHCISTRLQTMQPASADTRFHIYSQSAAPQGHYTSRYTPSTSMSRQAFIAGGRLDG